MLLVWARHRGSKLPPCFFRPSLLAPELLLLAPYILQVNPRGSLTTIKEDIMIALLASVLVKPVIQGQVPPHLPDLSAIALAAPLLSVPTQLQQQLVQAVAACKATFLPASYTADVHPTSVPTHVASSGSTGWNFAVRKPTLQWHEFHDASGMLDTTSASTFSPATVSQPVLSTVGASTLDAGVVFPGPSIPQLREAHGASSVSGHTSTFAFLPSLMSQPVPSETAVFHLGHWHCFFWYIHFCCCRPPA